MPHYRVILPGRAKSVIIELADKTEWNQQELRSHTAWDGFVSKVNSPWAGFNLIYSGYSTLLWFDEDSIVSFSERL